MSGDRVSFLLSEALRGVRITASVQFCFMPCGDWETDDRPAEFSPRNAVCFHIVADGACWLEAGGARRDLRAGDVAVLPRGLPHKLGAGAGGVLVEPAAGLPPPPWPVTPVLRFGDGGAPVRLLCGYVACEAMNFPAFREQMPDLLVVRTGGVGTGDWLAETVAQIVREADLRQRGGTTVLERLTEIVLLEILRRQFAEAGEDPAGWLGAARDPVVGRCLELLHARPREAWTLARLAREAGLSRSVLCDRFRARLGMAPMQYLRQWRLYLASRDLAATRATLASVAEAAGYGTEAAFNRAFSRAYGVPPAQWRRQAAG